MNNDKILKSVLENFFDGIIIADKNNKIVFINNAAERIRHISRTEKLGKDIIDCHSSASHERVTRALNFLKHKKPTFSRMVTDSSNNRIFENTYQVIQDESGQFIGTALISRDVTEKQTIEQEKLNYNQTLKMEIASLSDKLNSLFFDSLASLVNTLEAKDVYTKGHSERVTAICTAFVQHFFGHTQLLADIELAAKLHDIGKIGINESILNKPDKLSEEETILMRKHPTITAQILAPFTNLKEVILITKHHHERFDGKGYPDGLHGEEIPIGSRILTLADTFDAMTSTRPYRKALGVKDVIQTIQSNLGTQFDPDLGMKFVEFIESGSI